MSHESRVTSHELGVLTDEKQRVATFEVSDMLPQQVVGGEYEVKGTPENFIGPELNFIGPELPLDGRAVQRAVAQALCVYTHIDLSIPAQRRVADKVRGSFGLPGVGSGLVQLAVGVFVPRRTANLIYNSPGVYSSIVDLDLNVRHYLDSRDGLKIIRLNQSLTLTETRPEESK